MLTYIKKRYLINDLYLHFTNFVFFLLLFCAQWVTKDPSFLHEDSEDSDQAGQLPRLI